MYNNLVLHYLFIRDFLSFYSIIYLSNDFRTTEDVEASILKLSIIRIFA